MFTFEELRKKYPTFVYRSYTVSDDGGNLKVTYEFALGDDIMFRPSWVFPYQKEKIESGKNAKVLKRVLFLLGCVELVSYWKAACPPKVVIECGKLTDEETLWFKKLFFNGLGEFFYRNGISTDEKTFMTIESHGEAFEKTPLAGIFSGNLIPVGGGKDSVVTMELLRAHKAENKVFMINSLGSAVETARVAGYSEKDTVAPKRRLDLKIVELNSQGFLNGHTPFSAIVAFSALFCAIAEQKRYIVLSNESSANDVYVKGTTIKRKQREINFTEQSYLSILHGLNMARLKQKSLQITSATLKVINPPSFPIAAMPTKRKVMVLAAFFGTMIFILGYFILLELLDRTLRDRVRTERITGGRVLGAFPAPGKFRFRSYTKACRQVASQYLGNAVLNYFKPGKPNVINLLSTDTGTGKSFLGEQLKTYFEEIGLNVRLVTYHQDFTVERKNYLLAQSHKDFIPVWDRKPDGEPETGREDVVIIEHPSLSTCTVSKALLQEASVNIVVARANQVWKDTDQILFDKVREQAGETPVMLYLNMARREVVESFTGMLPPYTPLRKRLFRFYQFGLTSSGK